ncbi:MAG: PQQ-binding-like beta-propeller repeat protein [Thermoplasmata archaeon]
MKSYTMHKVIVVCVIWALFFSSYVYVVNNNMIVHKKSSDKSNLIGISFSNSSQILSYWNQYQGSSEHNGYSSQNGPTVPAINWENINNSYGVGLIGDGKYLLESNPGNGSLLELNLENGGMVSQLPTTGASCGGPSGTGTLFPLATSDGVVYERLEYIYYYGLGAGCYFGDDGLVDYPSGWDIKLPQGSSQWYAVSALGYVVVDPVGSQNIEAYVLSTGSSVWSKTLVNSIGTLPTIGSAELVFGDVGTDMVTSLSLSNGSYLWNFTTDSILASYSIAYYNRSFIFGTSNGTVYDLSSTGKLLWEYHTQSTIYTTPAVYNDEVFFNSGNYLYALNITTGNMIWKTNIYGSTTTSPVVSANGYVYTSNSQGELFGVNALNGSFIWKYDLGVQLEDGFVLASNTLIVSSTNGAVYSITQGYNVKFIESGLPVGSTWYVNLSNGQSFSSTNSSISFIELNGEYNYTVSSTRKGYTGEKGSFTVNGANVNQAVTFTPISYEITFKEVGLASKTSWSVTLNGTIKSSNTNTITFQQPNGNYSYNIEKINGYTASPTSGVVIVNGTNVTENITFNLLKYRITFTETGLINSTPWSINLNGVSFSNQYINNTMTSKTNNISFQEPNGTYTFTTSSNGIYVAQPSYGTIKVEGAPINQSIVFITAHIIIFKEEGLPTGVTWHVTLNGSNMSSNSNEIKYEEPNGNYTFIIESPIYTSTVARYIANETTGEIKLNGENVTIYITYNAQYYLAISASPTNGGVVTPSSGWYNASSKVTINAVANTNYEFISWTGTGNGSYSGNESTIVLVINNPITEKANFGVLYKIMFVEEGLPTGVTWHVTLNGITEASTNNTITFMEPTGTYTYNIWNVSGYAKNVSSGELSVSKNVNEIIIVISFTPRGTTSSVASLPNLLLSGIIIAIIAIIIVVLVVYVMRKKLKKPPIQTKPN